MVTDAFFAADGTKEIVGVIDLRHSLNDFLKDLGHCGYSVRPSQRQKGYARQMLARVLEEARRAVTVKQITALGREYGLEILQVEPDTAQALTPGRDALSIRSSVCVLESLLAPLLMAASGQTAYRLTGLPGSLRLSPGHSQSSSTTPLTASSSL